MEDFEFDTDDSFDTEDSFEDFEPDMGEAGSDDISPAGESYFDEPADTSAGEDLASGEESADGFVDGIGDHDSGGGGGFFGGLQSSIAGVLIGFLMIIGSIFLMGWNEKRAVDTMRMLEAAEDACVSVSSDKVLPENQDKLIHTVAVPVTTEKLEISDLKLAEVTPKIRVTVQAYQWTEVKKTSKKKKGRKRKTTYSYKKQWSSFEQNSAEFEGPNSEKYQNPSKDSWKFQSQSETAQNATFGAFSLTSDMIAKLPASEEVTLSKDALSSLGLTRRSKYYYTSATPTSPKIGDLRISIRKTGSDKVSIIAQQHDSELRKYQGEKDYPTLVTSGTHSMKQMFNAEHSKNNMLTWILRFVGFIVCAIGTSMILGPLTFILSFIPFLGDILNSIAFVAAGIFAFVVSFIVIAISWIAFRPMIGITLLVIVGVVIFLVGKMCKKRKASRAKAQPQH